VVCVFLIGRSEWRPRAGGQGRAGIQLLPVNALWRTSNSFTACFLAVDITVRMLTKCSAPVVDRKHPAIFWRSLTILMSRSAWLLSLSRYRDNDNYADVRIMPMLAPGLLWRAGIVLGSSA
jgi:hypothetical protein